MMKLGVLSAILAERDFFKMIDVVSEMGFACVEVACWPQGSAERRYAGVSHIDVNRVLEDDAYCEELLNYADQKGVRISALAYYPNTMDGDLEKREHNVEHLKKVILASAKLKVNLVTTFIGRDQEKTVEENLRVLPEIWEPILELAERASVRIAIENCPMLFGKDQWPGGQNIMTSPDNWRKVFEILKSDYLGINFDPSHMVWQFMDYIQPLYEFKDKIFHVHFKDIKLYQEKLNSVGIMAYPETYMAPKLPGLGDVKWDQFVSALTDIGYRGDACIEVEDRAFEGTEKDVLNSLILSKRYMEQYVI